jgi:tetratricopeptide (TPR) repeat protein
MENYWISEEAPFPFLWWDVAAVCLFSALPLGIAFAAALCRRASRVATLGLAGLATAAGAGVFAGVASAHLGDLEPSLLAAGGILRGLISLGLALAAALGWFAIFPRRGTAGKQQPSQLNAATFFFGAVVMVVVPIVYIQARCKHDAARAMGLVEQSRLAEARRVLLRLAALSPQAVWKGEALHPFLAQLQQAISEVQSRAAAPLHDEASDSERIERARDLAILGRDEEAIRVLRASPGVLSSGEGLNLLGTIYEAREAFLAGLESYRQSRGAWEQQSPSPERTEGLIQANRGLGYCARKLGRYAEAETAYLKVWELSPTADTHFLLARFYEDIEHTRKAETHARLAMKLAPDRYQADGEQLLDKLMMRHFGCFGVFRSAAPR